MNVNEVKYLQSTNNKCTSNSDYDSNSNPNLNTLLIRLTFLKEKAKHITRSYRKYSNSIQIKLVVKTDVNRPTLISILVTERRWSSISLISIC